MMKNQLALSVALAVLGLDKNNSQHYINNTPKYIIPNTGYEDFLKPIFKKHYENHYTRNRKTKET